MSRVIILWGAFELRMDAMVEFLIPVLGKTQPPTWKSLSFDKRKALFKSLTLEYTAKMFPGETETFRKLADQAGDLQWRRNTVAHGFIKGRSTPNANSPTGYDVVFYAVNRHKGKHVQIDLDNPTLEKLRHDIGHLGGNLMAAISRMGGHLVTTSPEIVVADRDFLQGSPSGNLPLLPTWKPPQSAPGSSPA
jgi:hypothetical protein